MVLKHQLYKNIVASFNVAHYTIRARRQIENCMSAEWQPVDVDVPSAPSGGGEFSDDERGKAGDDGLRWSTGEILP
jgi:hypothetical protein